MGFVRTNVHFGVGQIQIVEFEVGEFTNADTGLKKDFNDGRDADVVAASVAEGAVFDFAEDPGRFEFVFRVRDFSSGVGGDFLVGLEEAEEGFDGVNLAGDGFGSVAVLRKISFEAVDVFSSDLLRGGFAGFGDEFDELFDVFGVCENSRRSTTRGLEVFFKV